MTPAQSSFLAAPSAEECLGRVEWCGVTDTGRVRTQNEDAFLALEMDQEEVRRLGKFGSRSLADGEYIFAVSDGMGGHNAGEYASKIVVEKIAEILPNAFRDGIAGVDREARALLSEVVHSVHKELQKQGGAYEEVRGMGATLTLIWLSPMELNFCHIGDSRLYWLPAQGEIQQVTEDHTYVQFLVNSGQLTPRQAQFHPAKSQLTQALSAAKGRELRPQMGAIGYQKGDRFVLCSDGLYDGLGSSRMETVVSAYQDLSLVSDSGDGGHQTAAQRLVGESVRNSGKDNTTAIVVGIA